MSKVDKHKEWLATVGFYKDLIKKYGWKQEPMLQLIQSFNDLGIWLKTYPSQSHEALGLSPYYLHYERMSHRYVYILYDSREDNFIISFYDRLQQAPINVLQYKANIPIEKIKDMIQWILNK